MIRYSHAMTCLMAYHNKKRTEAICIVLQSTFTKQNQNRIEEETGIQSSPTEEDMREYLKQVMRDVKKDLQA
jgi:hypothetical protein